MVEADTIITIDFLLMEDGFSLCFKSEVFMFFSSVCSVWRRVLKQTGTESPQM